MHDNVSVVQFSCDLLDREIALVLKSALDRNVREYGLAGSGFTIEASKHNGESADAPVYEFDYQATVPVDQLYDVLMCLDFCRTKPAEAFDDEVLLSSVVTTLAEIIVLPNAEQSEDAMVEEKDQQIEFLMDKNDILSNTVNDHHKALQILADQVGRLNDAMQNANEQISAIKVYNYDLQAFRKIQQLVTAIAHRTANEDLLEHFDDFAIIH